MATVLERPRFVERHISNTTSYRVKSGIPIPPRNYGRPAGEAKYPFSAMVPGDCFDVFVSDETKRSGAAMKPAQVQSRIAVAARAFSKHVPFAKFATRVVENGLIVRVWRTA